MPSITYSFYKKKNTPAFRRVNQGNRLGAAGRRRLRDGAVAAAIENCKTGFTGVTGCGAGHDNVRQAGGFREKCRTQGGRKGRWPRERTFARHAGDASTKSSPRAEGIFGEESGPTKKARSALPPAGPRSRGYRASKLSVVSDSLAFNSSNHRRKPPRPCCCSAGCPNRKRCSPRCCPKRLPAHRYSDTPGSPTCRNG